MSILMLVFSGFFLAIVVKELIETKVSSGLLFMIAYIGIAIYQAIKLL